MSEFEQEAENAASDHELGLKDTAIVSIAISLKRIADKLELASKQPIMMNAEEALKYHQAKEAYDAGVAAMRRSVTPNIQSIDEPNPNSFSKF